MSEDKLILDAGLSVQMAKLFILFIPKGRLYTLVLQTA